MGRHSQVPLRIAGRGGWCHVQPQVPLLPSDLLGAAEHHFPLKPLFTTLSLMASGPVTLSLKISFIDLRSQIIY